jgi:hypothetical protein
MPDPNRLALQDDATVVVRGPGGSRRSRDQIAQHVRDPQASATVSTRAGDVSATNAAVGAPMRRACEQMSWLRERGRAPLRRLGGREIIFAILAV